MNNKNRTETEPTNAKDSLERGNASLDLKDSNQHRIYKISSPKINLALSCGIGGVFLLVGALLFNAREESWWLLIVIGLLAVVRGVQVFWKEHRKEIQKM